MPVSQIKFHGVFQKIDDDFDGAVGEDVVGFFGVVDAGLEGVFVEVEFVDFGDDGGGWWKNC